MANSKELIGVLQAISIVANKLAEKLMRIDRGRKERRRRSHMAHKQQRPVHTGLIIQK